MWSSVSHVKWFYGTGRGSDNVIDEHHRHSPNCSFLKPILLNRSNSIGFSPLSSVDRPGQSSLKQPVKDEDDPSTQLPSTYIKPPPMKSRCSSKSDDEEEPLLGYVILPVGVNTNQCLLKDHLIIYQKALMIVSSQLSLIMALPIIAYYPPLILQRLRLW